MKKLIALTSVLCFLAASTVNAQQLSGEFPEGGGKISVTASGGDVNAAGLDFASASGGLVPIEGGAAAPFTFLLSNTANQVTYGNLGSNITFADGSTTELSVGATAGTADILASWGQGATPVAFDVAEAQPAVVNSTITWDPAMASGTMVGDLIGDGSPITFAAAPFPGSTSGTGDFFTGSGGDTGNADLNTVLNSHGWNSDGATLVVDGLTPSNDYKIQLLMGDARGCCVERTQTASDGTNVSEPFSRGAGSVVGSFNALADSVSIQIAGDADPGLSGYLLWDVTSGSLAKAVNFTSDDVSPTVTIPEPSSQLMVVVAAAGALGLVRRRRR